jgi:hypothetical protein
MQTIGTAGNIVGRAASQRLRRRRHSRFQYNSATENIKILSLGV